MVNSEEILKDFLNSQNQYVFPKGTIVADCSSKDCCGRIVTRYHIPWNKSLIKKALYASDGSLIIYTRVRCSIWIRGNCDMFNSLEEFNNLLYSQGVLF